MIRFPLTFLLLLLINLANGQELKEVITRFKKSKAIMERYHVLKTDKKTKWGTYIAYFESGQTKQQGAYFEGTKKGIWTTFLEDGSVESAGNYVGGVKTGQWQYFHENGQVLTRHDHDNDLALDPVIQMVVKWPFQASMRDVKGTVFISYEVNSDCSLGEITVVRGLGYGCDEEAVRLTKLKHEFFLKYRKGTGPCESGAFEHPVKFAQTSY